MSKTRLVRTFAAIGLVWESLWPLLVPAICVALVFLTLSWLGVWQVSLQPVRTGLLALFAAAMLAAIWQFRKLRLPSSAEITRRVETASELEDRPITAQEDEIAFGSGDDFSRALWIEHRKRMSDRLKGLTSGAPAPDANRTDPWAFRALIAVIAFAAFGYSLGPGGGNPVEAFKPVRNVEEVLSRLDGWINPPTYTRKAPVYLTGRTLAPGDPAISVPQGSELKLRFVGEGLITAQYVTGDQVVDIVSAEQDAGAKAVDTTASGTELTHLLQRDGEVVVRSGSDIVAQWPLTIIFDEPPTITFTEAPTSALSGSLQLSYEVTDDYGVTGAEALISSSEESDPQARPLVEPPQVPLSLPRRRAKTGASKVNRDLSSHPWAGGMVSMMLTATDDAGQTGSSKAVEMILPGRRFSNPIALALIEQRRILALDARKANRVGDMLDAVLSAPEYVDNLTAYTAMTIAHRRIVSAPDDGTLRSALDLMWEIALAIEFGDLSEAERRLREAQERLSEALENGADQEEIAELMQELRDAMEEFMRQLAEEAQQNPMANNPFGENEMTRMLSQRDLERMMDRIEDLAKSGSPDAARQLLSEMQRMMDNLRAGRHMQQRQAEGNQTNQALDKLSELMRQQQQLMDESFQMQQRQPGEQQQQGQQQQGEGDPMTPEEFAEAMRQMQERQEALQQQLQELGEQLEALGLDPSSEFGEAGREMGEAGENLGQNNPGGATTDQGQALEALRRGAQSMMQQMAGDRQQGGQEPGDGQNGGPDRQRADPLGRNQQARGLEDSDHTKIPGEIDAQRAREIMEAIRERLAEPGSPLIERKYLERLLESE